MIEISTLRQFPHPSFGSPSSFVCNIVILEPQDLGWEHYEKDYKIDIHRGDWRYFNVYIINYKPRLELNLGISQNFRLIQENTPWIMGDIKANGLICFWNSRGKLRVSSMSQLKIEAFDPDDDVVE